MTNNNEDMQFLVKTYLDDSISTETWISLCMERDIEPEDAQKAVPLKAEDSYLGGW